MRSGGLENFSKINKRGGQLFGTREYFKFQAEWVLIYSRSKFQNCSPYVLITRFLYAGFYCIDPIIGTKCNITLQ